MVEFRSARSGVVSYRARSLEIPMRIARWFTVLIVSTIGLAFSVSAQLAEEKVTLELVETYARGERKVVRSVYRDEAGELLENASAIIPH